MPFWAWGSSSDPAELDDPSDELAPDRPEYPDGPDPEYPAGGRESRPSPRPVVTPVGTAEEEREGIGQHLSDLAHLSGNPRMRIWQRRVIIAVIAGVVFGIVLSSWKLGLTFAVLAAIVDTVVRSRTVFNGPAGVRLTKAQRRTVRQLARMERKGYRAMHIVPIPNSVEQIDHLVIGPAGVLLRIRRESSSSRCG